MTEPVIEKVIVIAPDAKFAVVLPDTAEREDVLRVAETLAEWWGSDRPFIVLSKVKLVRVDWEEVKP